MSADKLPRGFRKQADGEVVCPHRDLTCCSNCLEAHQDKLVDVLGNVYEMTITLEPVSSTAGMNWRARVLGVDEPFYRTYATTAVEAEQNLRTQLSGREKR